MRISLAILALIYVTGCGPMFAPMAPRLNPDEQHSVDQMWDNMLTPVQRVDHQTLLDATVEFWMYVYGADRLRLTSEKYYNGGKVVMDIDCDRANPEADQYTFTVIDQQGRTLRRERYTRTEVEKSSRMLHGLRNVQSSEMPTPVTPVTVEIGEPTTRASTQPVTQPITIQPITAEERAFILES